MEIIVGVVIGFVISLDVMVLVVVVFFIHFVVSKEGLESCQESLGLRVLQEIVAT